MDRAIAQTILADLQKKFNEADIQSNNMHEIARIMQGIGKSYALVSADKNEYESKLKRQEADRILAQITCLEKMMEAYFRKNDQS